MAKQTRKSQVGAIAPNFREGSRSEYLALYVLSSFGTAVAVPHQEDHGIDFYCTLTERDGQRAWAKASYTVQVKSRLSPWAFNSRKSVEWLLKHPLPLFLGIVNKKESRIRIYYTAPRFCTWTLGKLPNSLQMIPTLETQGFTPRWNAEYKFPMAPILDIEIARLGIDSYWDNARKVLEFWVDNENDNLARIRSGLLMVELPYEYRTNSMPGGGIEQQWLAAPPQDLLDSGIRHLSECLDCMGSQFHRLGEFVTAVEIGLLYRHMHQTLSVFSSDSNGTGMLKILFSELFNKLPKDKRTYAFAGIDEIQMRLEGVLKDIFGPQPA
jgi:hypothetical protein